MALLVTLPILAAETSGAKSAPGGETRSGAWSEQTPDHVLQPGTFDELVLSADAYPIDHFAWAPPFLPATNTSSIESEPIPIPLPTAGWAGLALLIALATWRSRHARLTWY